MRLKLISLIFLLSNVCGDDTNSGESGGGEKTSRGFPYISSFFNLEDSFTPIVPHQADLAPTNLLTNSPMDFAITNPNLKLEEPSIASNSPMGFNIQEVVLKLDETELSRSSPMQFSVPAPDFDLTPSFLSQEQSNYEQPKTGKSETKPSPEPSEPLETVEADEPVQADQKPIEPSTKTEEVILDESGQLPLEPTAHKQTRLRREVSSSSSSSSSSSPSFFSSMYSSSPFLISFPKPELTPGKNFFDGFGQHVIKDDILTYNDDILTNNDDILSNEIPGVHGPLYSVHNLGDLNLPPVKRPVRQFRPNRHRQPPRYPPFDPFHTVELVPLPGPSNPRYALPLEAGNPHMHPGSRSVHFNRPIRQSGLPAFLRSFRPQSYSNFRYSSSREFESSEASAQLRHAAYTHSRFPK